MVSVVRFVARGVCKTRDRGEPPEGTRRRASQGPSAPFVPSLVASLAGAVGGSPRFSASRPPPGRRSVPWKCRRGAALSCPPAIRDRLLENPEVAAAFRTAATVLFDTLEEQILASERLGVLRGEVIGEVTGHAFDLGPELDVRLGLQVGWVGRRVGAIAGASHVEPRVSAVTSCMPVLSKRKDGCAVLVEQFLRYQRAVRSPLSLVLLGRGRVELHESAHVRVLGDLAAAERRRVIASALAVLVPTRREALAPLCLEAWRESRPVLATRPSTVMRGVRRANGRRPGLPRLRRAVGRPRPAGAGARCSRTALGRSGRRALEARARPAPSSRPLRAGAPGSREGKGRRVRLAFVIQRYGLEVNGGAEMHCRLLAERLARTHSVEVFATRALDYLEWRNHYPRGTEVVNGIPVHRHTVKRRPQRPRVRFPQQRRLLRPPHPGRRRGLGAGERTLLSRAGGGGRPRQEPVRPDLLLLLPLLPHLGGPARGARSGDPGAHGRGGPRHPPRDLQALLPKPARHRLPHPGRAGAGGRGERQRSRAERGDRQRARPAGARPDPRLRGAPRPHPALHPLRGAHRPHEGLPEPLRLLSQVRGGDRPWTWTWCWRGRRR